jgi:solute carrier family 25 2-oxodicarboxylate transporter 21
MFNDLVAGFVGGVVGTTFNTPLDVVKSRIQSVAKTQGRQKYAWAWSSLGVVAREEVSFGCVCVYVRHVLTLHPH